MIFQDFLWFPLIFQDFLWFPLIFQDFLWFPMIFQDFLWFPMIFQDFPWFPMIFQDFPWFPMIFQDFPVISACFFQVSSNIAALSTSPELAAAVGADVARRKLLFNNEHRSRQLINWLSFDFWYFNDCFKTVLRLFDEQKVSKTQKNDESVSCWTVFWVDDTFETGSCMLMINNVGARQYGRFWSGCIKRHQAMVVFGLVLVFWARLKHCIYRYSSCCSAGFEITWQYPQLIKLDDCAEYVHFWYVNYHNVYICVANAISK